MEEKTATVDELPPYAAPKLVILSSNQTLSSPNDGLVTDSAPSQGGSDAGS